VSGVQAVCPSNLLGEQGCELLRGTLAGLARGTDPVLKELPANRTSDSPENAFHGWRADPADGTRFSKTIQGRDVEVRVGVALETRFEFTVSSVGARLSGAELASQTREFSRHVNRAVNTVLALATARWVGQKIEQHVAPTLKHKVRQKNLVATHGTNSVFRTQFTGFQVRS
jgi:hypothetical protein